MHVRILLYVQYVCSGLYDDIVDYFQTSSHRILSVKMDISAPCFILPRTFIGQETSMVCKYSTYMCA